MHAAPSPSSRDSTYQRLVQAWRLSEFIVDHIVKPSRTEWIAFGYPPSSPWGGVVESTTPAAPGVQLHFDVLHDQVIRSFSRRAAPWVPVPAGPPDEEILLWHRDHRGKARTRWLSTKEPGLIVADIPGMVLGSERYLWRWDTCSVLVPFNNDTNFMFEEDDSFDENAIELEPVQSARLTNVDNGVVLPLGVIDDHQLGDWVMSIEHSIEPLGTFGDIFVSVARAHGYSGGAHGWQEATFIVLDLQSGQQFELLTTTEQQDYVATFAEVAKQNVPAAMGDYDHEAGRVGKPEDPTITICRPFYDDDYALHLELQLTFDACHAETDENWDDYSASTKVETTALPRTTALPQTLAPLATAPAVLRTYWDHHPKYECCGWTRVPSTGRARELLEALVREHQSKTTDHR